MTIKIKRLLGCFAFLFSITCCYAAGKGAQSAHPIHFLNRQLTEILVNDNFSPPVASRVYAYTNIAAYAMLVESSGKENELTKVLIDFPHLAKSSDLKNNFSPSVASSFVFYYLSKKLIYTFSPFDDSFKVLLNWYRADGYSDATINRSQEVAKAFADSFIAWVGKDKFAETRRMPDYVLDGKAGHWTPTYPSYMPALEPHWFEIRKLCNIGRPDLSKFRALDYDTAARASLSKEAKAVYDVVTTGAKEKIAIADFWDCNAFAVYPSGHIMEVVKKISPGGHWMYIAKIAAQKTDADLMKSEFAYALTSAALFDAFIYTWQLKYQYQAMRPETFIQGTTDPEFRPYLQSPPFPEYPSGHAVISMAAATVLSSIYGDSFPFVDNTEDYLGWPARNFGSFREAALEAGLSRFYGGIHYKYSCDEGSVLGAVIGDAIVKGLKTSPRKDIER